MGQTLDLGFIQDERPRPGPVAIRLPLGDAHLALGITGVNAIAIDDQADDAETGPGITSRRKCERLRHLAGICVDEHETAHVFSNEGFAVPEPREVDGPTGKENLLAGWFEDLVRGNN